MKLTLEKTAKRILIGIAILFVVVFFAFSPIVKLVIEKNSEKWTGRKISMNGLFINLFSLDVTLKGLTVNESGNDSIFFKAEKIHTNLSLLGLIKGEYLIDPVEISSPHIVVEQSNGHFNFDDLLEKFMAEDSTAVEADTISKPTRYKVERIAVTNGMFTYRDKAVGQEIVIQDFNLNCPVISHELSGNKAKTDFQLQSGGKVEVFISLDMNSLVYRLNLRTDSLDLHLLAPYLKDYLTTSYAGGLLSCQLTIAGNFNTPNAIAAKGDINLSDFRLDDKEKQTVASWDNFLITIDSLNVGTNFYNFGEIRLENPYLLMEMYKEGNNFSLMMPSNGISADSIETDTIDYSNPFTIMADYIKSISQDYLLSNYTAHNLVIRNGHVVYRDYTLEDKFTYDLEELELQSGRIDSKSDSITFDLSCLANRSGRMNAHLGFDPRDYQNMSVNYTVEKMRISDFNPYSKFYVAHAFVEGELFYYSTNRIHKGMLVSTNKIGIERIEVSKRLEGSGLINLPLRLAIALLRDQNGNIKLDIPVEGDLKDPKYKLGRLIWQILKNIIVKAASAPFNLLANTFGANEEELKIFRFDYLQDSFSIRETKSLDLIVKSLTLKPEIKVSLVQVASRESEKELLALHEAKKRYYLDGILHSQKDSLSNDDLKAINGIANRDSLFGIWLNSKLIPDDVSLLPNETKSRKLIGEEWLAPQVDSLFANRNHLINNYLVNFKQVDPQRIKISNTTDEKSAQFESTPRYKIDFFVDESDLTAKKDSFR